MYKIYRYYFNGRKKLVKYVSTVEIAKLHCNDKRTKKEGVYFEGWTI